MAVPERHRVEWAVLAVLMVLLWCNKEMLDRNGSALYLVRGFLLFASALLLSLSRSALGFYQAIILLCILITYAALAYDVAAGRDILIYNNFEAWTHGLVACQLIGVFPTLRDLYCDLNSSGRFSRKHLPGSTGT